MKSRMDILNGCSMGAWSGSGTFPFGLISCPGWIKPVRRLSTKISSINRHYSRQGCRFQIVNIRPSNEGLVFDASFKIIGSPCPSASDAFRQAVEQARRSCGRLCPVCGARSLSVSGQSCCFRHASSMIRIETHFDKRKIRRSGVLLARRIGARITGNLNCEFFPRKRIRTFVIDGINMARVIDIPPGARNQIIDCATGVTHQESDDEWFIEASYCGSLKLDDRI